MARLRFRMIKIALVAGCAMLAGCSSRTPEERIQKAVELAQTRDMLGATLELRELIKKYPDDPRAVDAHLMLAQIAMQDKNPDGAVAETDEVLSKVTQKDPRGKQALQFQLQALQQSKQFPH